MGYGCVPKKTCGLSSGKGSELHQLTSYYPFQSILIDLLCLDITDNNSLEKRPADSLLRSKSMASNLHRTLSTNLHFSADFGSLGSLTRLSKSCFLASSPVLPFDLSMSDENLHENLGSREKALVRPSKEFSLSDPDLKSSDTMGARHAIATLLNTEGEAGNIPYGITISHGSLAAALGKGKSESCVKRSRLTVNRSTETVAASLENLSANESQQDLGSQSFGISELVVHTLQMLGEPVDLAPLLRDVIPWLPLEERRRPAGLANTRGIIY
ncbi:hypothetical protein BC829DRAFT_129505 [Chytridium lagenaria]|nr:hypothetical protein BC829DRAFT_129505 [Chytridium lagenaria]